MSLRFETIAQYGQARLGRVHTARGSFDTPCFMPVGTRAALRTLSTEDIEALGAQVLLANTYHLMLRPGAELVEQLGGVHGFMDWQGHVLTDSGGYQVFSLNPRVDDAGVTFRSTYDGTECRLTAEHAVDVQLQLGSDIQMVLDVCPPADAPPAEQQLAVQRTADWAARARRRFLHHEPGGQSAQFGIVQGGTDPMLRAQSAAQTVEVGFEGYALGGLSVGEERPAMLDTTAATLPLLPTDRPRYLMGLGDPSGLLECVALGVDMFDCVLPTRLARHGTVLTWQGRLNLKAARYARDEQPLDPAFPQSPAGRYSRAYLRHLLNVGEPSAARLLTLHNVAWLLALMEQARTAVADGSLPELRRQVSDVWG